MSQQTKVSNTPAERQEWQIEAIKQALKKANSKKAKFIGHEEVVAWLNTWGCEK